MMLEHNDQGHTYLPSPDLFNRFINTIRFEDPEVTTNIKENLFDNAIY